MRTIKISAAITLLLLTLSLSSAFAQPGKPVITCSQSALAAFKPLPKLEYECPAGLDESDDKTLKLPARITAVERLIKELTTFTEVAWWREKVQDLERCELRGRIGKLSDEEIDKWQRGDFRFDLFGNNRVRLVLVADPCYQTGYNGSSAFLLYRKGARVFVTQVLNGYYSRLDNSVEIDFAMLNGRQIIEIETANTMPPSFVNYYFEIDPVTNRAVPAKLFRDGRKLSNQLYSAMLLGDMKDFGLPESARELSVIRHHRLAPTFSAYEEDARGTIGSNGSKMRRVIYRWNGRVYFRAQ